MKEGITSGEHIAKEQRTIDDGIRPERLSVKPELMLEVRTCAQMVTAWLTAMYGKIIPPEKLAYNENIAKRVVVTDDLARLAYEWEPRVRKSAKYIQKEFLIKRLSHELLHQYQDWQRSEAFLECGVAYYQEQFLEHVNVPYYPSELRERRTEFYASLRDTYGEEVDQMFFGSPTSPATRKEIMVELRKKKKSLFPGGIGL